MFDLERVLVRALIGLCLLAGVVLSTATATGGADRLPARPPGRIKAGTTEPVGADVATTYFPQVALGSGYTTSFTLTNTGSTPLNLRLTLTDSTGAPMGVLLPSSATSPASAQSGDRIFASYADTSIPVGGAAFFTALPVYADRLQTGWAKVDSTGGALDGVATFRFTSAGRLQTIAGVLATSPTEVATVPVDNDDSQQRFTGYAIANPGGTSVSIRIVVVDQNGVAAGLLNPPPLNALGPYRHEARFLHEDGSRWLKFKGSMVLIAPPGQKFCVVALVQDQGQLTAIPVVLAKPPTIN